MVNNYTLLSTASLQPSLIDLCKSNRILLDVTPFINILPEATEQAVARIKSIAEKTQHVVFTSANAVKAVANITEGRAQWQVWSIAGPTHDAIKTLLPNTTIVGTATNGALLAIDIIDSNACEVVFFCGDKRLPDVPVSLHEAGIKVKEISVYNTVATPVELQKQYDGILFFSPSAVRSFFSSNPTGPTTAYFCIGATTAREVLKYTHNPITVSEWPTKKEVVKMAIEYFTSK